MCLSQRKKCNLQINQGGFTLVEMIMVIVITGILGVIVDQAILFPVQGYVVSARRADMTDIADTAMRRLKRDLRKALPSSVRISGSSSGSNSGSCTGTETCYLEFIPTRGGGSYISALPAANVTDTSFVVLGTMPTWVSGEAFVFNNYTTTATLNAYSGINVAFVPSASASSSAPYTFTVTTLSTWISPSSTENRFQVITTPVTYVCSPVTGGTGGTLTRYMDYTTLPETSQPITSAALSAGTSEVLTNYVGACPFAVNSSGLVTLSLTISETDNAENVESIYMYDSAYVSNSNYP